MKVIKCPKCGEKAEVVSKFRKRIGGEYVVTHDVYEHASRIEGGVRVVSSSDCCFVPASRLPTRAVGYERVTVYKEIL